MGVDYDDASAKRTEVVQNESAGKQKIPGTPELTDRLQFDIGSPNIGCASPESDDQPYYHPRMWPNGIDHLDLYRGHYREPSKLGMSQSMQFENPTSKSLKPTKLAMSQSMPFGNSNAIKRRQLPKFRVSPRTDDNPPDWRSNKTRPQPIFQAL